MGISFRLWGNLRLGCKHYLPPPQYCVTFKFPHIVKRKMSLPEVFFPWFVGGSDIIRRPNIFFQFARASFSHSVLSPSYHANNEVTIYPPLFQQPIVICFQVRFFFPDSGKMTPSKKDMREDGIIFFFFYVIGALPPPISLAFFGH